MLIVRVQMHHFKCCSETKAETCMRAGGSLILAVTIGIYPHPRIYGGAVQQIRLNLQGR